MTSTTALVVTAVALLAVLAIAIVAGAIRDSIVAKATGQDPAVKRREEKERKRLADLNGGR